MGLPDLHKHFVFANRFVMKAFRSFTRTTISDLSPLPFFSRLVPTIGEKNVSLIRHVTIGQPIVSLERKAVVKEACKQMQTIELKIISNLLLGAELDRNNMESYISRFR